MVDFLKNGPADAPATIILAHGAGAPMDSEFMEAVARRIADCGLRALRFEFEYMADRRVSGRKRPPPAATTLTGFYRDVVEQVSAATAGDIFVAGKSMGGRVASLIVDELVEARRCAGLICLGYPFHPPGKPEKLRTGHLEQLSAPALICQGERDPFGSRAEVASYPLSGSIELCWLPDGNHDLVPRKSSGYTAEQNWNAAVSAIAGFVRQ